MCPARKINIGVRWIASEFTSVAGGSRERDNAYDATKSLVDHFGSGDRRTLAAARTSSDRQLSHCEAETLAASDGAVPWQKKRRTLCVSSWTLTMPKILEGSNFFTVEAYGRRAPPQSAFDVCGPGDREVDGDSSATSNSDEEMPITGRARILQRGGHARVGELVKMTEGMPAEARRLGALEMKAVTRKTLELFATSVRDFCDRSGLSARACREVAEVQGAPCRRTLRVCFSRKHFCRTTQTCSSAASVVLSTLGIAEAAEVSVRRIWG